MTLAADQASLGGDGLERLAFAAFMVGRVDAWERAYHAHLATGDRRALHMVARRLRTRRRDRQVAGGVLLLPHAM